MNAIVSGSAGKAYVHDNESWSSFDVHDIDTRVPETEGGIGLFLTEPRDIRFLEDVTLDVVFEELKNERNRACALDLGLIVLDPEISEETRLEALTVLEELLSEASTKKYFESVLHSKPLPDSAFIEGTLHLCKKEGAKNATTVFGYLRTNQLVIKKVCNVWNAIPIQTFGGIEQKAVFEGIAAEEGLFFELVQTLVSGKSLGGLRLTTSLNPHIEKIRNHRVILQELISPFDNDLPNRKEWQHREAISADSETRRIQDKGKRKTIDRTTILEKIESQKNLIIKDMKRGNLHEARRITKELVSFQMVNGGSGFTAKSLCDLAAAAKELGLFPFQLELTQQSVALKPDDGWAWTQHGNALLNMHLPTEAAKAFDQAEFFGVGLFVMTGRAEVLKSLGRLKEALSAYDEVIAQYPDDVVAKNGRAEVLKSLGRLDEALSAYDDVITQHPEDTVAKAGRAEALKSLGRLNEALSAYDRLIAQHPEDVIAKNGRAGVLKSLGRLEEALSAYDSVIDQHPESVVAKNGRAEVLKSLGQLEDALGAYDEAIAQHPEDVVAKTGRAEALKSLGQLDEALSAYDLVIAQHPEDVVAKTGRAEVLKALGQLDGALSAYDEAIAQHPESTVAKNGRAEVLKSLGQLKEALSSYDSIIAQRPEDLFARNGRSCVLAAMEDYPRALEYLPDANLASIDDWIGYHIRGMVLLKMGMVNEAMTIFERGVRENPWVLQREFFRTALSVAHLRQGEYVEASQSLHDINSPELEFSANVLRLHSFGALKRKDLADIAYQEIRLRIHPIVSELAGELYRRFLVNEPPLHNDDWLITKEIDMLLLAA